MVNAPQLQDLRDVHLPTPVPHWMFAPGWYVVALFIVITCIGLSVWLHRRYVHGSAKRQALKLLITYEQNRQGQYDSQKDSAYVSEILKRVALVYYPRSEVAHLQGNDWLAFLNNTAKGVDFNLVRTELLQYPFQPAQSKNIHELYQCAKEWIKKQGKPCSN